MKRLYISDLDGTLLSPDQTVTAETYQLLNRAIDEKGINFTFATARTAASAVKITERIKINVPCILMNGVSIYDISRKCFIKTEYIPDDKAKEIARLLDKLGQNGFMYKISNNKLFCFFTELDSPEMYEFWHKRRSRYDKPFEQITSFSSGSCGDVIYFTMLDKFEKLDKIRIGIEKIGGLKYEFYRDIYNDGVWYLEVFSDKASKYSGVQFLREKYGFDEIICFGDNLNDLPMFRASDVKVAVENAKDEVKSAADHIAPSNIENGAAEWIWNNS